MSTAVSAAQPPPGEESNVENPFHTPSCVTDHDVKFNFKQQQNGTVDALQIKDLNMTLYFIFNSPFLF